MKKALIIFASLVAFGCGQTEERVIVKNDTTYSLKKLTVVAIDIDSILVDGHVGKNTEQDWDLTPKDRIVGDYDYLYNIYLSDGSVITQRGFNSHKVGDTLLIGK